MKEFFEIFQKVNGNQVLKEYAQAQVLLHALLMTAIEGTSRKSLEIVRESVNNKIVKKLRKKYAPFIAEFKKHDSERRKLPKEHSNKVWVCWLQGMEEAPPIVKRCCQSLLDHLNDREIILLDESNYREWVTFPGYIQQKIADGTITKTHMTDLLRLELLEHYGGTWIDATVFCSGGNIPDYILDSDLFLYQNLKPGLDAHARRVSTWLMTSCTNHPIIVLTKELLYSYWENHGIMVDYFLIHDFMELAIETYPEEWKQVVPFSNSAPHVLLLRLNDKYDEKIWKAIKEQTPFHKLTYKYEKETGKMRNTYYSRILIGGVIHGFNGTAPMVFYAVPLPKQVGWAA